MNRTILFVTDVSISRIGGGAERVLYEQCRGFLKKGYAVINMTRKLEWHRSCREARDGIQEWRYPARRDNAFIFMASTIIGGCLLFNYLNARYHFGYISLQQPFSSMGAILSPGSGKVPRHYTCHSLSFEEYRSRNEAPAFGIGRVSYIAHYNLRRLIEKWAMKSADRVIVLSEYTREKIVTQHNINGRRIWIIPGGVDALKFHPVKNQTEMGSLRKQFGLPENRVLGLTVRNLVPRMGLENLIDAMPTVAAAHADVLLVVGGEGPLGGKLDGMIRRKHLTGHVRMAGFIPEDALPDYYRMADFFVLPTRELEGFGLVTLEALASGIPVLGTPVGGTKEILGRWFPELMFKGTDPESMAELMITTIGKMKTDPDGRRRLGERCRRVAATHYSWDRMVDRMEALFMRGAR